MNINKKIFCYTIIVFLFQTILNIAFAQDSNYVEKKDYDSAIIKINDAIKDVRKSNKELKEAIKEQKKANNEVLNKIALKEQILKNEITEVKDNASRDITSISDTYNKERILWLISIILIMILGLLGYTLLKKNQLKSDRTLSEKIIKTREELEKEVIKLDSTLIELLESQLKIMKEKKTASLEKESNVDHSLALRVGEEIHRMRKRIENMPTEIKGIGALTNSLKRLEEEFNANGYEIVDLLGKPWNDGLNVSARFIPSDDLKPGEEMITKVIKPQINFKNNLIKAAEIEVSTGG